MFFLLAPTTSPCEQHWPQAGHTVLDSEAQTSFFRRINDRSFFLVFFLPPFCHYFLRTLRPDTCSTSLSLSFSQMPLNLETLQLSRNLQSVGSYNSASQDTLSSHCLVGFWLFSPSPSAFLQHPVLLERNNRGSSYCSGSKTFARIIPLLPHFLQTRSLKDWPEGFKAHLVPGFQEHGCHHLGSLSVKGRDWGKKQTEPRVSLAQSKVHL